jgi:hypothetical protein
MTSDVAPLPRILGGRVHLPDTPASTRERRHRPLLAGVHLPTGLAGSAARGGGGVDTPSTVYDARR